MRPPGLHPSTTFPLPPHPNAPSPHRADGRCRGYPAATCGGRGSWLPRLDADGCVPDPVSVVSRLPSGESGHWNVFGKQPKDGSSGRKCCRIHKSRRARARALARSLARSIDRLDTTRPDTARHGPELCAFCFSSPYLIDAPLTVSPTPPVVMCVHRQLWQVWCVRRSIAVARCDPGHAIACSPPPPSMCCCDVPCCWWG